ncbi:hypothetical protein QQ045_007984 [Rhodiola kirilowii]
MEQSSQKSMEITKYGCGAEQQCRFGGGSLGEYRTVSGVAGPLVILEKVKVLVVADFTFTWMMQKPTYSQQPLSPSD